MSHSCLIAFFTLAALSSSHSVVVPTPILPVEIDGRIIGGNEASITKYPYQVSVRLDSYTLIHICGGSVYAPLIIISAAHCIKGRFASNIRIVAGESTLMSSGGLRVTKLLPHSDYKKKTHANDVGLIILAENLIFSAVVQPIALAKIQPAAGLTAIISGWGWTDEEAQTLSQILQAAELRIVDIGVCRRKYLNKQLTITSQMLCAAADSGGMDACKGDSGGPLVVDGKLAGIVSWGFGCAHSEFPGVYASVADHAQWIESNAVPYL